MEKNKSLLKINKEKGIKKLFKSFLEIIKSKTDKDFILSTDSPEVLKRNKDLILRTIEKNANYLNSIQENKLIEELEQEQLPENGIIITALKKGYKFCNDTPKILLSEKGKKIILEYLKLQKDSGLQENYDIKYLLEQLLDEDIFEDTNFRNEVFDLSTKKGYNLTTNSPDYLKENSILAKHYYKKAIKSGVNFLKNNNIMSPKLLNDRDFLGDYIQMLKEQDFHNDDIMETLMHNDDCIGFLKQNKGAFEYVFENLTPSDLNTFFSRFFNKDELDKWFLSSDFESSKLERLSELYKKDDTILESLNGKLLDKKYDSIEIYKMQLIGKNIHGFQEKLLSLNDFKYKLYLNISKYIASKTNRWNRFEQSIVENLADGYYDELCEDLLKNAENGNKISSEDIEKLTLLLSRQNTSKSSFNELWKKYYQDEYAYSNNTFNITTQKELQYYEEIKELVCDTILLDPSLNDPKLTTEIDKYLKKFRSLSEIDRVKLALLEKYYNMDLREAKSIVKKFSQDIKNIHINNEYEEAIVEQILAIKNIYECEDFNALRQIGNLDFIVQNDLSTETFLVEESKELFENEYQKVLYNPEANQKIGKVSYNGTSIDIYDADVNFSMIVKRVSANQGNAKNIWNSMTFSTRKEGKQFLRFYTSTSYMTAENLLNLEGDSEIILGFGNGTKGYPFDSIHTGDAGTQFQGGDDVFNHGLYNLGIHMTPDTLETNTNDIYNEIVINTLKTDKDGITKKMQPDYIVYISNGKENNLNELENDPLWIKTKKAASEFSIPIVLINKEKVHESEKNKIEEMSKTINLKSKVSDLQKFIGKVKHYGLRYRYSEIAEYIEYSKLDEFEKYLKNINSETRADSKIVSESINTQQTGTTNNKDDIVKRQTKLKKDIIGDREI